MNNIAGTLGRGAPSFHAALGSAALSRRRFRFIFRGYHALPPLTRSDGKPIAAVLGFSNMLPKLL